MTNIANAVVLLVAFCIATVGEACSHHHDHHSHSHIHNHDHDGGRHDLESDGKGDLPRRRLQEGDSSTEVDNFDPGRLCGTPDPNDEEWELMNEIFEQWVEENGDSDDRRRKLESTSIVVPIYFHNAQPSEDVSPLTDEEVDTFLKVLRHGFRNTPFKFYVAGVDSVINAEYYNGEKNNKWKKEAHVGGPEVLNVFVCDTLGNGDGYTGFTYYPPITRMTKFAHLDGVVISHPAIGAERMNDELLIPQILIHEVAHWLGLAHTFMGECAAEENNNWMNTQYESYIFVGDGVKDTPAHAGPTWKMDGYESCWAGQTVDTCPDRPDIDAGGDPIKNYMNYLPGKCFAEYGEFTSGQVERMLAEYEAFRLVDEKFTMPPTPAPVPAPLLQNLGSGSGDPHFKTWTGDKFDYHGECDLVLVHNPSFDGGKGLRVHVRTTRVRYFSYIERVAIQIGDDVLEFDNDINNFRINGQKVEPNVKHHKTLFAGYLVRRDMKKAISIRLDSVGKAKIDLIQRRNGFPAVIVDGGDTDIFQGSLGLLGEWSSGMKLARDGVSEFQTSEDVDDDKEDEAATAFALEWQVRDDEPMLFETARYPQYPQKCVPPAKRMKNRLGKSHMEKEAEKVCAHWKHDMEDCIFDVIATRDVLIAAEGSIHEHIAEVER